MKKLIFILVLSSSLASGQVEQIQITRVEQMPNTPSPYLMRDWREVAIGYDNYVFDASKTGDYLPLIFTSDTGKNYPDNGYFGLDTYVGTLSANSGEAINILPSLIGASLVEIDKSNQNGTKWVLMSQDFFNNRPEENVYLNNREGQSGSDWWYDVMPNIYFYQLADLYPGVGASDIQFTSVANQWLKAVKTMGGSNTPWTIPFMDYRAWSLSTMTPLVDGVKEPEAAGGIGWLLYSAYIKTGYHHYLEGAEQSMEFLSNLNSNPSYELQLPYGVYTAAKMNAQMNTAYDIEKMVNWTFDRGDLRGWGTIVGSWNGMDVSGLIGEANDQGNDYAFLMNGFQHASALVPMVRYDKRFARAIGKWMLNLANASRLFYPGFLPEDQQNSSEWSGTYDPLGYIGYEGLREKINNIPGPYSTGDAIAAGWSNTDLALYGSSAVGVFGGIIKTTNVEKILQLDLLKTDFYREEAYRTYLYYNPYPSSQLISINTGASSVDLYDAISETFLLQSVSGTVDFTIEADKSVQLVLAPAGGVISYDLNRMLINDVVVDYMQTSQVYNSPPRIKSLATTDEVIELGGAATIFATTSDREGELLTYSWSQGSEPLNETEPILTWPAPATVGDYKIVLVVSDEQFATVKDSIMIQVVDKINTPPVILDMISNKNNINPLESVELSCLAEDADDDLLSYSWSTNAGTISGAENTIEWQSPLTEGFYSLTVVVTDGKGGSSEATTNYLVKDYSRTESGSLIAYYPFTGNADDQGGFNNFDGQVTGATLVEDLNGKPGSAYYFDGINDFISVRNNTKLNFTEAITISCWVRPEVVSTTEAFILSHGSWQNRWKLSINSGKLRWTINTTAGIKDVDSSYELVDGEPYHVTATYDGANAILYINGMLDAYASLNGAINISPVDLLFGRMLPDDMSNYNYQGLLDEVIIYDYALNPEEAISLMESPVITTLEEEIQENEINIYPNPTTGKVYIDFNIKVLAIKTVNIYNIYGQVKNVALNEIQSGRYQLDISTYPDGIYYVQVSWLNNRKLEKILVVK